MTELIKENCKHADRKNWPCEHAINGLCPEDCDHFYLNLTEKEAAIKRKKMEQQLANKPPRPVKECVHGVSFMKHCDQCKDGIRELA